MGHCISKQQQSPLSRPDGSRLRQGRRISKRVVAADTIRDSPESHSHHLTTCKEENSLPISSRKAAALPTFSQTYKILPKKKLGHGIAGEVHQCIHLPTSQPRAVKIMAKKQIKRKDRIAREIEFLKQVKHPNIIQLYDVYEDKQRVHLVTEICHGGELFDRIVDKQSDTSTTTTAPNTMHGSPVCFREKEAAGIIRELLRAVSYLHSIDIVHRDIKPENILFTKKEDDDELSPVKLIDFGLAIRHTAKCKPITNPVGTSYYMAPELLEGKYDRACDLWSIGVITYVLLAGCPPFNGPTDDVIMKKVRRGQYKMEKSAWWDRGVSEYGKDFMRRLMDMDPKRRWTADMALGHPWLKLARVDAELFG